MTIYELMVMHRIDDKGGHHEEEDFNALDENGNPTNVDSNSCLVGKPKEIVDYLLGGELSDYKLVKRKRKEKLMGNQE